MRNALTHIKQAEIRTRDNLVSGTDREKVVAGRKFAAEVRNALTELGSV